MIQSHILKTILITSIALAVLLIIGLFLTLYICNKQNIFVANKIAAILPLIENYHVKNGKYPERIEEVRQFKKINNEKVLFLFSGPAIRYLPISDGFKLYYHQCPLGPFYGYDSREKRWYYEE